MPIPCWRSLIIILLLSSIIYIVATFRRPEVITWPIPHFALHEHDKIPVYYINTDTAKTRRDKMELKLKHNEPLNKRVRAIVPNDICQFDVKKGRCTNDGVTMCCLLSHIKAVFTAYHNNAPFALFLEDDAEIERWPVWHSLFKTAPRDWEMLRFFVTTDDAPRIYASDALWRRHEYGWWGAVAHVINRKGMKKILRSCVPEFGMVNNWDKIKRIDLTKMAGTGASCLADDGLFRILDSVHVCTDIFFNIEAADSGIQADRHIPWHMEMRTHVKEALAKNRRKFNDVYLPDRVDVYLPEQIHPSH